MSLQQEGAQTTLDAIVLKLRAHHGTLFLLTGELCDADGSS